MSNVRRSVHSANAARTPVSSRWPPIRPHTPGMHPPKQDARALYRDLTRILWAIHCKHNTRAKLVIVVDRYDVQINRWRREYQEGVDALEALRPDLVERLEERRRAYDNPQAAIEWASRDGGTDDIA